MVGDVAASGGIIGETRLTVGRVTDIDQTWLTIDTPADVTQVLTTTAQTVVVKASAGAPSDVAPGARVIIKYADSQRQRALEFVVLASDSLHGVPVLEATAESITVRTLAGSPATVDTTNASVDKSAVAAWSDISIGSMIFARAKIAEEDDLVAEEIIVLPVDTVFGTG